MDKLVNTIIIQPNDDEFLGPDAVPKCRCSFLYVIFGLAFVLMSIIIRKYFFS